MNLQKSKTHFTQLIVHVQYLQFSYKETCKNERGHFYTVSFKLSVKNKTGKSQKVRVKAYKVVNLISRCAGIISMDMDIHG